MILVKKVARERGGEGWRCPGKEGYMYCV